MNVDNVRFKSAKGSLEEALRSYPRMLKNVKTSDIEAHFLIGYLKASIEIAISDLRLAEIGAKS